MSARGDPKGQVLPGCLLRHGQTRPIVSTPHGQYLIGSVLFLIGGLFNYWRAHLVVESEIERERAATAATPGAA